MRLVEFLGQIGRGLVREVEGRPGLQGLDRGVGVDRRDLREGGVLGHNDPVGLRKVGAVEVLLPGEARRVLLQLGDLEGIVGLIVVPALGAGPGDLGDLGLQGDDRLGVLGRALPAGQGQHLGDVLFIGRLLGLEAVFQIIVAVGQAEAALHQIDRVFFRVLGVVVHIGAEERSAELAHRAAHQAGHLIVGLDRLDRGQVAGQRLGAQRVDRLLVHEAAIEGAQLGLVALGRGVSGRPFRHRAHPRLRQFLQRVEGAVARPVGRDLQLVEIGPVRVVEEVLRRR
ncbi:MAG: hypothetical protein K0Q62_2421, partial [Phenylobacterium sp.]|nr:hypothetical protein [Phenylobacterium sp.]